MRKKEERKLTEARKREAKVKAERSRPGKENRGGASMKSDPKTKKENRWQRSSWRLRRSERVESKKRGRAGETPNTPLAL